MKRRLVITSIVVLAAGAGVPAPAVEAPCGNGTQLQAVAYDFRPDPVVIPVAKADGLDNVLVYRGLRPRPISALDTLDGGNGAPVAQVQFHKGFLANRTVVPLPGGGEQLTIALDTYAPCRVVAEAAVNAQGRLVRRTELGHALRGSETPDERALVTAPFRGDFDGDGTSDATVDIEGSNVSSQLLPTQLWGDPDYREATPRQSTHGRVEVVGATGKRLASLDAGFGRGPGPLSGFAPGPRGSDMLVAVLGSPQTADRFEATVVALDRHGELWRRKVPLLEGPATFLVLDGQPAIVTKAYTSTDAGALGPKSTGHALATSITILDPTTGKTTWSRDWNRNLRLYAAGGDLIVDDLFVGGIERVRGSDGAPVWTTQFVPGPQRGGNREIRPADMTGDGMPDLIFYDTPTVATVIDGATGEALPRATFGTTFQVVPDIDGDGAQDVVTFGEPHIVPSANTGAQVLAAVSGTGAILWETVVPIVPNSVTFASAARLRSHARDVVLYHHNEPRVFALDGLTGAQIWSQKLP